MTFESYETIKGYGCIIIGQAGSSKTTILIQMVKETRNPIVLAFTNKAIKNIKDRISKAQLEEFADKCHTFDAYLSQGNGRDINSLKGRDHFHRGI